MKNPLKIYYWSSFFVRYEETKDFESSRGFADASIFLMLFCITVGIAGCLLNQLGLNDIFDHYIVVSGINLVYQLVGCYIVYYFFVAKAIFFKEDRHVYGSLSLLRKEKGLIWFIPPFLSFVFYVTVMLLV